MSRGGGPGQGGGEGLRWLPGSQRATPGAVPATAGQAWGQNPQASGLPPTVTQAHILLRVVSSRELIHQ